MISLGLKVYQDIIQIVGALNFLFLVMLIHVLRKNFRIIITSSSSMISSTLRPRPLLLLTGDPSSLPSSLPTSLPTSLPALLFPSSFCISNQWQHFQLIAFNMCVNQNSHNSHKRKYYIRPICKYHSINIYIIPILIHNSCVSLKNICSSKTK